MARKSRRINTKEKRSLIKELEITYKNLEEDLDLSDFINLEKLYCDANSLTGVNINNCQKLRIISCSNNQLTELDLTNLSYLEEVYCSANELTSLKLSHLPYLKVLRCRDNYLTNINLRNCQNLETLYCSLNKLINLNLNSLSQLKNLKCRSNELTELDLTGFPQLKKLDCSRNKLTNLNLSNCEKLENLKCWENQISQLDLRKNKQLIVFACYKNQISQLILPSKLPNLEKFGFYENLLSDLDFATLNREKLVLLSLGNNNFALQDLGCLAEFTNLKELYLGNEDQVKIYQGVYNRWTGSLKPLQNMKQLYALDIGNTDLDSGTKYLPTSIMEIYCSYLARPESKVKSISKELEQNSNFMLVNSMTEIYLKKKLNSGTLNQLEQLNFLISLHPFNPLAISRTRYEKLLKELIPCEWWRNHYKEEGLCANCQQLNGWDKWCQSCNVSYLRTNFSNWTSGDLEIDKFIQKCQLEARNWVNMLEWIPYENFINVEYLAEGGFSKIYKTKWIGGPIKGWNAKDNKLERWRDMDIALKNLNNSQDMDADFLREIINYKLSARDGHSFIVNCYGISQDPETGNYVMVMSYMPDGNLRQFLQSNYKKLSLQDRLFELLNIVQGLESIHKAGLIHKDFHVGNILNKVDSNRVFNSISDLGLSRPANETNKGKIYGVLPYVAPEVLRGKPYTQASDIYSLGMIAYELFTNFYPYFDQEGLSDKKLGSGICWGLRPDLEVVKIPQLLKDLISRCWDSNPEQRATANEILIILKSWIDVKIFALKKNTQFYQQYQKIKDEYNQWSKNTIYRMSPNIITHSKVINTQQIVQLFQESKEQVLAQELKHIEALIEQPLTDEPKEIVKEFIRVRKEMIKNKNNEKLKGKALELEDQLLDEKGLSEENIERIIKYCKRFVKSEDQSEQNIRRELAFSNEENWTNINSNLTSELVQEWKSYNFTYEQCREWINISPSNQQSIAIKEPAYYAWLRDVRKMKPEEVLNYGDSQELNRKYLEWYQQQLQFQIEINSKK